MFLSDSRVIATVMRANTYESVIERRLLKTYQPIRLILQLSC